MEKKDSIRKKILLIRKKKYFEINESFFNPLIKLLKKNHYKKKNISIYYPNFYELNILKIFNVEYFRKSSFSLPIVGQNNSMQFYKWKLNEVLTLNKYGVPEPIKSKAIVPDVMLLPLLAYDKQKNRLGYGKGFYDKYLNRYFNNHKNILTVGIAFSFQKHLNLPVNNKDFKLDFIITEKGIL